MNEIEQVIVDLGPWASAAMDDPNVCDELKGIFSRVVALSVRLDSRLRLEDADARLNVGCRYCFDDPSGLCPFHRHKVDNFHRSENFGVQWHSAAAGHRALEQHTMDQEAFYNAYLGVPYEPPKDRPGYPGEQRRG